MGGSSSGLWGFGSARSFAAFQEHVLADGPAVQSPPFALAAAMDTLGCAVALDDGVDTVFVRLAPETAALVEELARGIRDAFGVDINPPAEAR
jgi:hypothetical protein